MRSRLFVLFAFCFVPLCAAAQDFAGVWEGALSVNGGSVRLLFRVSASERGYEAVLDSPDQGGVATLDRELEELLREENLEPGDHERFSHYVKKDKILESAITGKPVRALCGKKWTPGRDPEKFPICPTCKEIYESMVG